MSNSWPFDAPRQWPKVWQILEEHRCSLCKGKGFTRGYIAPSKFAEYECTRCCGDGLNTEGKLATGFVEMEIFAGRERGSVGVHQVRIVGDGTAGEIACFECGGTGDCPTARRQPSAARASTARAPAPSWCRYDRE